MTFNEKLRKYRKDSGLTQENLASKIFVSRTLITKYESGAVYPTAENLDKIAQALGIDSKSIMSDQEKNEIAEQSYNSMSRLRFILNISAIIISAILIVLSLIPILRYGHYVYPIPPGQSQPDFVSGYSSIIGATLNTANPIAFFAIALLISNVSLSLAALLSTNGKYAKAMRIINIAMFACGIILFLASLIWSMAIISQSDFSQNIRIDN
ncbi:MAG: helix-turn-helix transcriptional regulator [Bacilli bacterium]|jgi:transcriptional regulator with XRE-family HTH domain